MISRFAEDSMRRLTIGLISRSNANGGGASRIAEELGEWLNENGHAATHFCANPVGKLQQFQTTLYPSGVLGEIVRFLHRSTRLIGLKEIIPLEYYTKLCSVSARFDVLHFHDLDSAIAPLTLRLCSLKTPVVFTAHDCSCFTGGCIYPMQCERYKENCGKCPQTAKIGASIDMTPLNLKINRKLANARNLHYVFPSVWLRELALGSMEFRNEPVVIPNGFSASKYSLKSKKQAREKIGISYTKRVIVVAAHFLGDPRKGIEFAISAICSIGDLEPLVIFIGNAPEDLESRLPDTEFLSAGFVQDRKRLGLLIAAADIFLFTSLQDNLPIMVQESLAAGTPIVGFAAGGVREMIDHGRSGLLCDPYDQKTLNENLRSALTTGAIDENEATGREAVRQRYNMTLFGERHRALYEKVAA